MPTGDWSTSFYNMAEHPDAGRNKDYLVQLGFVRDNASMSAMIDMRARVYINEYEVMSMDHETFKLYMIEQYRRTLDQFKKEIKKKIDELKPDEVSAMRRRNERRQRRNERPHNPQVARQTFATDFGSGTIQPFEANSPLHYYGGDTVVTTASTTINPGEAVTVSGSSLADMVMVDEAQSHLESPGIYETFRRLVREVNNTREVPVPEGSEVSQRENNMSEVQQQEGGVTGLRPSSNENSRPANNRTPIRSDEDLQESNDTYFYPF